MGEHTNLATLYVFFAVLGGLKTFGGLGVIIGPLVLAITVALFRFLREEKRAGSWSLEDVSAPIVPLQTTSSNPR